MKCTFAQARKDMEGVRKKRPVECKLYNAAKKVKINKHNVQQLCSTLLQNSKKPPFSYLLSDQKNVQNINTVVGNVPLGTYLGYQLQDKKKKESVFHFTRTTNNVLPAKEQPTSILPFPNLFSHDGTTIDLTEFPNTSTAQTLLDKVRVNQAESTKIHNCTVQQSASAEWNLQRKYRLTASNFGRVLTRKQLPSSSFLDSLFKAKDLSRVKSISHGKRNETLARTIYSQKMQKKVSRLFTVYESGLVVPPSHPYLAATPDGKVFDPTETSNFGLIEIKCPYTWRNMTLQDACEDDKFYCSMDTDGRIHLKKQHANGYYSQVQGQLALSGLSWCDFIIYLSGSRNMNVERVYFDHQYWSETIFPKLKHFYFQHCINYLMSD